MKITDVRIRKLNDHNRLKAVASVTLDDMFAIHEIKIVEGNNGLFISMPSRKTREGGFKDIAHPINSEARALIQDTILEKYAYFTDDESYAVFET